MMSQKFAVLLKPTQVLNEWYCEKWKLEVDSIFLVPHTEEDSKLG